MKISVVIPVYKNKKMFLSNLKENYLHLRDYEIIIVDDASNNDLESSIKQDYPDIKVVTNTKNLGFAKTVNVGFKHVHGDLVMLLNSDVRLLKKFDENLWKVFDRDKQLFALSFMQKEADGDLLGKNVLSFQRGLLIHDRSRDLDRGPNAWANGGSSIFRSSMIKKLRGFNEAYSPFYWEDIDLSYRAYSRGWHVIFEPNIMVEHHRESTIKKFYNNKAVSTIAYRNQLLCIWSNITDISLSTQHVLWMPIHMVQHLLMGDFVFLIAIIQALARFGYIAMSRTKQIQNRSVRDKVIIEQFKSI